MSETYSFQKFVYDELVANKNLAVKAVAIKWYYIQLCICLFV